MKHDEIERRKHELAHKKAMELENQKLAEQKKLTN
jgi:hypothetical protein